MTNDYSKIIFSRRFRPSHKKYANVALGYWNMEKKQTVLFLASWKSVFITGIPKKLRGMATHALYRKLINTLSHEVIHGVIQDILEKDKWSGSYDPHFPHLHGADPDYKRTCERLERESN